LDGDGRKEIIAASYSVFCLDGDDGSLHWSADPPGGRVWAGVVAVDLNSDGQTEIVTSHGGGYVHVFDHSGAMLWSRQPISNELRGLAAADIDRDGTFEIVVNGAVGSRVNTWVFEHDGDLRSGWPQLDNESGYAYGVFNDNSALGDLDGDGIVEIVVPSDVHYICAYELSGVQLPAHSMYGSKAWGAVGIWESLATELRGWGHCNGALAAPTLSNIDGDADLELVLNTAHSGFVAYDLPDTANAVVFWGTGRGSNLRSGAPMRPATPENLKIVN